MNEIWKDIAGYEGRYQISTHGRVRSMARCWQTPDSKICLPESIMTLHFHYRGYMDIKLRRPPKEHKNHFIHRLMAQAFLPNPENKPIVNHKDRDKQHNCINGCAYPTCKKEGNLEWATGSENVQHYVALDKEAKAQKTASDMAF